MGRTCGLVGYWGGRGQKSNIASKRPKNRLPEADNPYPSLLPPVAALGCPTVKEVMDS